MANVLKIKRSAVASKIPLTTDLQLGELAINTNDGRLFTKKNVSATDYIVEFLSTDSAFKTNVVAATTANITLSAPQTIDGVAVVAGDRVLVKNQSAPAENGIYIVAAGAWTRAPDMDTAADCAGAMVGVRAGTTNGGRMFDTDFKSTDTLGTTSMVWGRSLDSGAIGIDVQAWDADLDAIAGLAGTSGFLKKTAANTWTLDTSTYLTGNQTITLSGDITGSGTTAITTTIAANAVTNADLAQVATATFKGRTTAGTGNVEDLTATQATALLNTFSSTLKGLVPASGGGTTNFLRADGTWAAPGASSGVSSISFGSTGLTPSTATTGAVTVAGTLAVGNGGTGATTLTGIVKGNGTSAFTAAVAGTDYAGIGNTNTFTANQNITGSLYASTYVVSGNTSGSTGLATNDGYGNANVAFNHIAGTPDATGSSCRISCAVDSATASMAFQLKNSTTSGVAVSLTTVATFYETSATFNVATTFTATTTVASVTMSGTITGSAASLIIGTNGGVTRGYLYNDGAGMGILNNSGGWGARLNYGTNDWYTTGSLLAAGNVAAYYSDRRLKKDIQPIKNALEKVNKISGVTFISNEVAEKYGYKDARTQVGVIAQEVEAVLPEVVVPAPFDTERTEDGVEYSKSGENYKTVLYDKIVPLLIEAIKELTARVEELERK